MNVSLIETARLLLRPFRVEDEEGLFRLWNASDVRRYLWDDKPVSRETVATQLDLSIRRFRPPDLGRWAYFVIIVAERLPCWVNRIFQR
jgi:RimJ/RimL family protein N-acetyltransferase